MGSLRPGGHTHTLGAEMAGITQRALRHTRTGPRRVARISWPFC